MNEGFIFIDKSAGPTSHDIINQIRRLTKTRRVGHAGTLDPFATGLLIVAVGRSATKELGALLGLDKTYEAAFAFGAFSDTDDRTGKLTPINRPTQITIQDINSALPNFIGNIKQKPPQYAAIKKQGKKLYEFARAGIKVETEPRQVRIDRFEQKGKIKQVEETTLVDFEIDCSSGTYIRALARDLGTTLGTGGYVQELRRTKIGPFSIDEAANLEQLKSSKKPLILLSIEEVLKRPAD